MSTRKRRGPRPLRDFPALFWLVGAALVAVAHPVVLAPRWLMIHLLLLGALSHSILVWSRYFTETLLHTTADDVPRQSLRLLLLNGGVMTVVAGVVSGAWPVTAVGAVAVSVAVIWHGVVILRLIRSAFSGRFGPATRYYVAAACFLPVGATLGVLLARGLPDGWHMRLTVAHAAVNLLGWIGLTVAGTLVTLWPAILRTRISDGAERAAARALPILVLAVLGTAGSAVTGSRTFTALGLLGYVAGLALTAPAFVGAIRRKRPESFAAWSVLAALCWLVGCLVALAVGVATADSWADAGAAFGWLTPFLAAGFGAQVLLGALSYLVPVALRGGPRPVRAASATLDRGAPLRVVTVNGGLLVCAAPTPSVVRILASMLVLAALVSWLPLLVLAIRASVRAKRDPTAAADVSTSRPPGQAAGLATAALAALALVVAVGVAVDPAGAGARAPRSAAAGVRATGETTTVEVTARDMRFHPSTISVPAGNRLVVELTNTDDENVHDLVLDNGIRSDRLAPGESARLDVGVVGKDVEGWCSVLGHRQMGMVLHVRTTGATSAGRHGHEVRTPGPDATDPTSAGRHGHHARTRDPDAADALDVTATPPSTFRAADATLPPPSRSRLHRRTLTIRDVVREVAPGVTQRLWTYNGTVPGPVLHGRVGDRFEITLVNRGSIGHSVDFHAGALAPRRPMRTIAPGQSLVYRFRATRAGIWMYHCSTMPMSAHIANGLFGAVVVEPADLPEVDRTYVLVQSEFYLGRQGGPVNPAKLRAERPDALAFNGYVNQYDHRPLRARVGERVRIWVLDAGPNRPSSFHVIGAQFDTVYAEGAYLLRGGPGGAQALGLHPAQGGFVELTFPEPGTYPFVSHLMVDAERGAHGTVRVSR